jgi:hypothetical protein
LLDAKAPQDAAAFKTWLRDIAQKAAEAANEGGFLGFGGVGSRSKTRRHAKASAYMTCVKGIAGGLSVTTNLHATSVVSRQ